jgi:tetratricopeptide (TPR) repeat protein
MATIPLRVYFQHIDHFIEQKQFDEAIAHCKHILNHYPKSLETYRLMGKALLEKNRFGDAGDIFQRVLSSAPDDFISHVGMAIVREDEGGLDAALWHMERAFESNPANGPAQEELRRLYGRRDGVVPPRAQLTRGALARMYVKGELYPQAELELRAALRDDPERLDLSLLLARVLLETGRRAEAAELSQSLLQKIPYALEALRIVSEILAQQNRADEAKFYQQRLAALDPYEAYANGHSASSVAPEAVRVPELGEAEGQEAALALGSTPDWATSLGEKLETPPAEAEDVPDWLKAGTGILSGTAPLTGALSGTDMPAAGEVPDWLKDVEPAQPAQAAATDMPDWMKATTGIAAGHLASESGSSITGWLATPEQPASPFDAPVAGQADMPDWLKDIAPPTAPLGGAPLTTEPLPSSLSGAGSGALPEWLNAPSEPPKPEWMTGKLGDEVTANLAATTPMGEAPEWMKESTGALPGSTPELPEWMKASPTSGLTTPLDTTITPFTGEAAPESMPDWLKTSVEGDDLPDWLKTAASTAPLADAAPTETGVAAIPPLDTLPAWMQSETIQDVPPVAEPLPDWMQPGATQMDVPVVSAETPAWMQEGDPQKNATAAEELPDWLKEVTGPAANPEATPPAPPAVDLPDFLQPASAEAIDRANTPVDWEEPETEAAEAVADVPDWIKAMAPDPNAAPVIEDSAATLPPVAAEELPDWLQPAAGVAAAGLAAAALGAASTPAEPAPAETEDVPDLSSMSADDAMRWLESLAAKQGAEAETLITKPEERTDTPPAWVSAAAAPEVEAIPAPAQPEVGADVPPWAQNTEPGATETIAGWLADKDTPDWLRAARAETRAAESAPVESQPPAAVEGAMPDLDTMSPDDALRWLESLAAKQGAEAETLITKPEERTDTPPAWLGEVGADAGVSAPAPAAPAAEVEATAAEATPAEELPDWLKAVVAEEEAAAPAPVEPVAAPAAPVEAAPPSLSDDDAMRWLEMLAARQGAESETLTTQPEERTDAPPAWLTESSPAEERSGPLMPPTGVLPDIFGVDEAATQPVVPAAPPAAEPLEIPPATMSDDDAMRWLESLAARQGAEAETLTTQPEERTDLPPAWVSAAAPAAEAGLISAAEPAIEEEPAPEPLSGPPDWQKITDGDTLPAVATLPPAEPPAPPVPTAPPAAAAPPPAEEPREPIRTGDKRLSQLATRLAADRRAREVEIAARFERERAEREKAQREVMEKMEQRRSRRAEAETGALKPSTGMFKTSVEVPAVRPVPPTEADVPSAPPVISAPAPEPRPARKPAAAVPVATRLTRSRKRRRVEFADQPAGDVWTTSRQQLLEGRVEAAAEGFAHLVSGGRHIGDIITELEAYTAARGQAASLYRVLGDAYMRAGKLQRALDAYRSALTRM